MRRARELVLPEGRCMVKVKNPAFWEQCAGVKTVIRTTTQDMDAAHEVALQYAVPARAASVASKVRVLASAQVRRVCLHFSAGVHRVEGRAPPCERSVFAEVC